MEDDSSKRGVVIKGPWKKVVEQKIDKEIDVREDLKMIAEMHKVLLHQLIFTLKETGYDIESDEFVNDRFILPDLISIYGIISNCSKGLCFSPAEAIILK